MKEFLKLVLFSIICSEYSAQTMNSSLNSLISTEYSFSKSAAEVGTRDAFLKFISDDGIIFRPNPVNGKKFLSESKPSGGLLSWYPVIAFVSRAGDLGFTTGPWQWRQNRIDSVALAYGNYCTVWQREANNEWKFVIDLGNRNDKPSVLPERLKIDTTKLNSSFLIKMIKHEKPDELIELDKQFALISSKIGVEAAYKKFVNDKSRLLRDGKFPIIGRQQISEYFTQQFAGYNLKPIDGRISSSKDFGFTYGELEIIKPDSVRRAVSKERNNYMRIWKKEQKRWIIIVEVANIIPQ
ncbi:YybH family protein [Stygiobacter electus]|uniref:DUF4440 domain-containing protein n=1 Tax=Stygiobacter electus TaxID=3032292 RepID=A0AAE3TEP8_9BACT|nr:hypothetical protein [Stygiobacter electus]MDF1612587.1 hypothetical protein [Stygiobacter electus]